MLDRLYKDYYHAIKNGSISIEPFIRNWYEDHGVMPSKQLLKRAEIFVISKADEVKLESDEND